MKELWRVGRRTEVNLAMRFLEARSWAGLLTKFLVGSRRIRVQRTKRHIAVILLC